MRICLPPGPLMISLRKRVPAALIASTVLERTSTSMTTRSHPPGSGRRPSGGGRAAELPGPLSQSVSSSRRRPSGLCPVCARSLANGRSLGFQDDRLIHAGSWTEPPVEPPPPKGKKRRPA